MEIAFDPDYEETIKREGITLFDMLCVVDGEEVEYRDLEFAEINTLEISIDKQGNPVTIIKQVHRGRVSRGTTPPVDPAGRPKRLHPAPQYVRLEA